jgi:nucleotide-binding universal stress UspA family protein
MNASPSILCPIDFSDASAGALLYAAAIASHLSTKVVVLTVEEPLLTEALDFGTGASWTREHCQLEMEQFAAKTFGTRSPILATLEYEIAVGKPAEETLRVARERSSALIVISTHGLTGIRKLFFGSTTERVLRETTCPVLITPPLAPGHVGLQDAKRLIRRILVPVDLSPASGHQTQVASRLAEALGLPLILVHVIEPLKSRLAARLHLEGIEADRRSVAEDGMTELLATIPKGLRREALVVYGDPSEEVAKVARDRDAGLMVVGLHGSPLLSPRMGSVTYRLLCLAPTLVLALPPEHVDRAMPSVPSWAMACAAGNC